MAYLIEEKTYTGNVVSFDNPIDQASIASLSVPIQPTQNLNGYSKPWAGGTGKNILPYPYTPSSSTVAGIQVTVNDDGSVVLDGTTTSKLEYYLSSRTLGGPLKLGAGDYILTGCPKGYESKHLRIGYNRGSSGTTLGSDTGDGVAITQTDTTVLNYGVWIACDSGTILDNLVIKPMVRLASETDQTWEPYSNICPISGSTGVDVYVSPTQDQQDATTYASDWTADAGTVYGGTVDIKSGTLTVDRVLVSKTWADGSNAAVYGDCTRKRFSYSDADDKAKKTDAICNVGIYIPNDTSAEWAKGSVFSIHNSSNLFYLSLPTATDGTQAIQLCMYLETPVIYQLTAQTIAALSGANNVWASNNLPITVVVRDAVIGFQGWLIKVGENMVLVPTDMIKAESYKVSPNQRMEESAERDTTGVLWRETVPNMPPKIEFNTPAAYDSDVNALNRLFHNAFSDYDERKLSVAYYDPEEDVYKTWDCYMPNIEFPMRTIDVEAKTIFYDEIRYAFIGY